MEIPTFKLRGGGTFRPSEDDIKLWTMAYPGVAIQTELWKMAAWIDARPGREKKLIKKFITNWLNQASRQNLPNPLHFKHVPTKGLKSIKDMMGGV